MFELKIDPMIFGIYECPLDWKVNEKGTVFHRLYYAYEGEAYYSDDVGGFPLEKAHIYLFPVNRPYNIIHHADNPFKCLFFHITTRPLLLNPAIGIDTAKSPAVFHMIKILEHILQNMNEYPNSSSLLPQLLNCLINLFDAEVPLRFSDESCLQKVLDHIHSHSGEKLTNSRLANVAGFDRFYFARLFRKNFGVSPQEYIFNYRLIQAENLLRKKVPVKNVAELAGFQDEKAFSRAFKKARGCPPSRYAKSHSLQP
jgi:AraC-type DNA-binding domain-containing proteins